MNSPSTAAVKLAWMCVVITCLAGCSMGLMVRSMDPLMEQMASAVNMNPDVDMVRDALPSTLIQMDGLIQAAPNEKLLLRASEAYFGYTFAFVENTDKRRARMLYRKARDYALRVLLMSDQVREHFDAGAVAFVASLAALEKEDVPALYWTASNWMAWIALNLDNPEVLLDIPKIEGMLLRVVELDETYYDGAAHAMLGAYYASRAPAIGGDPAKAKQHFDRAFDLSESKLLFVHLLYAQYYAYQIQDRDLFVKTLEFVAATPDDYYPPKTFANEIAKRKARSLLADVDNYF